ncbi:MAG: phosphatidate cytidylyltransferase [Bacteroidota bacterium]|nr:phosphatidate cytidylyltransferase [Bacteroidota bacterium]
MNETLKRALSGALYIAVMWFGASYSELTFNLLFTIILIVCLYEIWKLRKGKSKLMAFAYVIIPLLLIQLFVRSDSDYPENSFDPAIVLIMFILTWTFDTFAYLFGIAFGKHKIMPSVSPKKSWEGYIGGFVFTIIAAYFTHQFFDQLALKTLMIISIVLPLTATVGDFIESYYKREAGVKDSGNFIPGHGGMLDRMDAFLITIPVIYIIINLL